MKKFAAAAAVVLAAAGITVATGSPLGSLADVAAAPQTHATDARVIAAEEATLQFEWFAVAECHLADAEAGLVECVAEDVEWGGSGRVTWLAESDGTLTLVMVEESDGSLGFLAQPPLDA